MEDAPSGCRKADGWLGIEARGDLRHRESILEDAFLYEKRIDSASYERQRDKIRENIALARIELEDARVDEIDIEGLLGFAEHVLGNAARLWMEAPAEQKRRLQEVLFPEGLRRWAIWNRRNMPGFQAVVGI